ncbi:hypothetical protein PAV_7c02220 [Paenibacillus alvei DSM 29]|nr:hypothetical protein PAV_7c02220 [Paenibacillus alvei DSM 29]
MRNLPVEMYNYHTWANQTILNRINEIPSSVRSQEVTSSFPTIAMPLVIFIRLIRCGT